jgi:hypothetical protein
MHFLCRGRPVKCERCGTENPEKNRFCSSCGKLLQEPLDATNPASAGSLQGPVPAAHPGSGWGLILLGGGALFLVALVCVGLFVILPMFGAETPVSGVPGSSFSGDLTGPDAYGQGIDPSVPSSGAPAATPGDAQPVQGSSSPSTADLIIGTWDIQSSALQMQFSEDGTATLVDPVSMEYSTGSWEKIADGRYRLRSSSGTEYPVLHLDPIAGTLYAEDYSMVFIGKG